MKNQIIVLFLILTSGFGYAKNKPEIKPIAVLGINNYYNVLNPSKTTFYTLPGYSFFRPFVGFGLQGKFLKHSQLVTSLYLQARFGLPIHKTLFTPNKGFDKPEGHQFFYDLIIGNQLFMKSDGRFFLNVDLGFTIMPISVIGKKFNISEAVNNEINPINLYSGFGWKLKKLPIEIFFNGNILPFVKNQYGVQPQIKLKYEI